MSEDGHHSQIRSRRSNSNSGSSDGPPRSISCHGNACEQTPEVHFDSRPHLLVDVATLHNMRAESDLGPELSLNTKATTYADKVAKRCGVEDFQTFVIECSHNDWADFYENEEPFGRLYRQMPNHDEIPWHDEPKIEMVVEALTSDITEKYGSHARSAEIGNIKYPEGSRRHILKSIVLLYFLERAEIIELKSLNALYFGQMFAIDACTDVFVARMTPRRHITLAMMGVSEDDIKKLRETSLTCRRKNTFQSAKVLCYTVARIVRGKHDIELVSPDGEKMEIEDCAVARYKVCNCAACISIPVTAVSIKGVELDCNHTFVVSTHKLASSEVFINYSGLVMASKPIISREEYVRGRITEISKVGERVFRVRGQLFVMKSRLDRLVSLSLFIMALTACVYIGASNAGRRDNWYERTIDSVTSFILLSFTVAGLIRLKSEDPEVLSNIVKNREPVFDINQVIKAVGKGVEQLRLEDFAFAYEWVSEKNTSYNYGRKRGEVELPGVLTLKGDQKNVYIRNANHLAEASGKVARIRIHRGRIDVLGEAKETVVYGSFPDDGEEIA